MIEMPHCNQYSQTAARHRERPCSCAFSAPEKNFADTRRHLAILPKLALRSQNCVNSGLAPIRHRAFMRP